MDYIFYVVAEEEYRRATWLRTRWCRTDKGSEFGFKILISMWDFTVYVLSCGCFSLH